MKMVMNIEKRRFFGLIAFGLIFLGIVGVVAFNSDGLGGTPSNFGHSVDEIDWDNIINSSISVNGDVGVAGILNVGDISTSGSVNASELCIGDNCITDWENLSVEEVVTGGVVNASNAVFDNGESLESFRSQFESFKTLVDDHVLEGLSRDVSATYDYFGTTVPTWQDYSGSWEGCTLRFDKAGASGFHSIKYEGGFEVTGTSCCAAIRTIFDDWLATQLIDHGGHRWKPSLSSWNCAGAKYSIGTGKFGVQYSYDSTI